MKLNRKGFTLIELLAVITILGILMIVGIPAVQRTITNSRKDTFYDTAKEYVNAVKTAWAADDIMCGTDPASSAEAGKTYAIWFNSGADTDFTISDTGNNATTNKQNLLQSGGGSPWNSPVAGYVLVDVPATGNINYSVVMVDKKKHGFASEVSFDELGRDDVEVNNQDLPAQSGATGGVCTVNTD